MITMIEQSKKVTSRNWTSYEQQRGFTTELESIWIQSSISGWLKERLCSKINWFKSNGNRFWFLATLIVWLFLWKHIFYKVNSGFKKLNRNFAPLPHADQRIEPKRCKLPSIEFNRFHCLPLSCNSRTRFRSEEFLVYFCEAAGIWGSWALLFLAAKTPIGCRLKSVRSTALVVPKCKALPLACYRLKIKLVSCKDKTKSAKNLK